MNGLYCSTLPAIINDCEMPPELVAAIVDARLELPPPPPSSLALEIDTSGDNALDCEF